jgi:hypothetical protein
MEYASCIADAVQLVLDFDLPEESVPEAVRSRAGLLAHLSQEDIGQPD